MLDRLQPRHGAKSPTKRVGRGPGSGLHKTSGRGMKGQGHRSAGRETRIQFEGGQMPLVQRVPKRGFYSRNKQSFQLVNLNALGAFDAGATVDLDSLVAKRLVRARGGKIKILGDGEPPKNLVVKVGNISAAAKAKIEAAGGSVEILL
jgi:large subunit ribosomal protein L15